MSGSCPTITGPSTATTTVENGWSFYSAQADSLVRSATAIADDLAELDLATMNVGDVSLNLPEDIDLPGALPSPAVPDLTADNPDYDTKPVAPGTAIGQADTIAPPDFTDTPPDMDVGAAPVKPAITLPVAPYLPDRDVPDYTDPGSPELPSFKDIIIPVIEDLDIADFTKVAPDSTGLVAPGDQFTYQDTAFSSTFVDNVQAQINTWITGSERLGLADTVWDQLWEDQRTKELEGTMREISKITQDWATRGFGELPIGPRDAAIRNVRMEQLKKEADIGRGITVKAAEMEVDQLRFAVERGIALTQVLTQTHHNDMSRAFAVAQYTLQAGIDLFNAAVSLHDVKLKGYQIEASAWATTIDGKVKKLEVIRLKLEAQRLTGDANKNDLDLYLGQWQGVKNSIDAYTGQVNAVNVTLDGDRTKLQLYSEKLKGLSEQTKMYVADVDAFRSIAGVKETQSRAFESAVRAHLGQIEGIKSQNDVAIQNARLVNEGAKTEADIFGTNMRGWGEGLRAQSDKLRAEAAVFDGQTRLYEANSRHQSNQVNAQVARYNAAVQSGRQAADIALKRMEMDLGQLGRIQALEVNGKQVSAQLYGQLGAATMSAVNLGANITASDSDSRSCSTSYTYSF